MLVNGAEHIELIACSSVLGCLDIFKSVDRAAFSFFKIGANFLGRFERTLLEESMRAEA